MPSYRETSQLICRANQMTGFYIMATLAFNELMQIANGNLIKIEKLSKITGLSKSIFIVTFLLRLVCWFDLPLLTSE